MVTKDKYLPTRTSKIRALILIGQVIGIYLLDNSSITSFIGFSIYSNIIKPVLWGCVILTAWLFPRIRPESSLRHRGIIYWWSFFFAIVHITFSLLIGVFIEGLGKSPYSHTLIGILKNILLVGSSLVGREVIRGYIVLNSHNKSFFHLFVTALLMTVLNFSLNEFISFSSLQEIFIFFAENIIPEFSENLLATYLVLTGGCTTSLIYLGFVNGFYWLSPILPNFQWITKAVTGILFPIFFLMFYKNIYYKLIKKAKQKDEVENPISWVFASAISIGLIWFSVGVFPIYPSVIITGSMEPLIKPGDVILVHKTTNIEAINNLQIGDIILFKKDDIQISHRIIAIKEDADVKRFITKGDNNSGADQDFTEPKNIKGKVVFSIPKLGWPTLLFRSKNSAQKNRIEF